jgi:Tol biopolymer transport system component
MWFPDGRSVLVRSQEPAGPGPNFYRIDLASGRSELVLRARQYVAGCDLSPDGKTLFYAAIEPPGGKILRYDLESHQESDVKQGKSLGANAFGSVALSPDGKQLAYSGDAGGGTSYLAVMPVGGGPARELLRGVPLLDNQPVPNVLAWTPDQKYLIFERRDNARKGTALWRVPLSGGPAEEIGVSMPGNLISPQVRRDGRQIVFMANEPGPTEVWALDHLLPAAAGAK